MDFGQLHTNQDFNQRHSDGANLEGKVPGVRLFKPRAVATLFVALEQAQSIAPIDVAAGVIPCTFGESTRVLPFNDVGIPLPRFAAIATTIGHGLEAPVTCTLKTYLLDVASRTIA